MGTFIHMCSKLKHPTPTNKTVETQFYPEYDNCKYFIILKEYITSTSLLARPHEESINVDSGIKYCFQCCNSVYGHITLKAPVLVRSLKLSNVEPG